MTHARNGRFVHQTSVSAPNSRAGHGQVGRITPPPGANRSTPPSPSSDSSYGVVPRTDRIAQTLAVLGRHQGEAAIVYCVSRRETERLAARLAAEGLLARPYHAGLDAKERHRTQDAFAKETIDVVVATVAFGMGIDRSDVRLVLHTALPKSLEAYQQETGRAGRDGLAAECVLLYSSAGVFQWEALVRKSAAESELDEEEQEALVTSQVRHLHSMRRYAQAAGMPRSRNILDSRIRPSRARPATSVWARRRAWPTRPSRPRRSSPAWLGWSSGSVYGTCARSCGARRPTP